MGIGQGHAVSLPLLRSLVLGSKSSYELTLKVWADWTNPSRDAAPTVIAFQASSTCLLLYLLMRCPG